MMLAATDNPMIAFRLMEFVEFWTLSVVAASSSQTVALLWKFNWMNRRFTRFAMAMAAGKTTFDP